MEELQEETGHTCVVCGEGEAYRPGQVLGCYCFSKRVPLLSGGDGLSRQHEMCYTTVTHFNVIHASCSRLS